MGVMQRAGGSVEVRHLTLDRLIALAAHGDVTPIVEGMQALSAPPVLRVGIRAYRLPTDLLDLQGSITYGQRLYLAQAPTDWLELTLRMFSGWFSGEHQRAGLNPRLRRWLGRAPQALTDRHMDSFGRRARWCFIAELLPATRHIGELVAELLAFEVRELKVPQNPKWLEAGGAELARFGALAQVKFLAEALGCDREEVFNRPYSECLSELLMDAQTRRVEHQFNKAIQEELRTRK